MWKHCFERNIVIHWKLAIRNFLHSCIQHQISSPWCLPVPRTFLATIPRVVTPVPIPNTVVKHPGPMIVRALAKVGIARFIKNPAGISRGVFVFALKPEALKRKLHRRLTASRVVSAATHHARLRFDSLLALGRPNKGELGSDGSWFNRASAT